MTLNEWLETGEWLEVSSSWVFAVAYDKRIKAILVMLKGTSSHRGVGYHPVERVEAAGLFYASSKGKWIWDHFLVRGTGGQGKTQVSSFKF